MSSLQVGLLVILGVLAGAMIPAILQLAQTMRSVRRLVEENQRDVRSAISLVGANAENMQAFFDELKAATDGVRQIRGTLKTAALVSAAAGPAIGAVIRAFQENKKRSADRS